MHHKNLQKVGLSYAEIQISKWGLWPQNAAGNTIRLSILQFCLEIHLNSTGGASLAPFCLEDARLKLMK